jgi:dipeptidase
MCDTLCVRAGDTTLFAKNSDRHPAEVQVLESRPGRPIGADIQTQYLSIPDTGAYAVVGSRPTWLWGYEHGINENRVAIGNEKVFTTTSPRKLPPALLGMDLVRLGLERATDADDALDVITRLLDEYGQGGSGEPHQDEPYFSSFLIADPTKGWILETSNRTWAARPLTAGGAITNRISLSHDWTIASDDIAPGFDFQHLRDPRPPLERVNGRLATTTCAVDAHADARALAHMLRDHGRDVKSEFTVCMHRPDFHSQTTASMIAELRADAPLRIWTALGNPCCSIFVPGFPPAIAPELTLVAEWNRFVAVRDAVEGGQLDAASVAAVFHEIEVALWSEANDAYATGERGPLEKFIASAYEPVDFALRQLGV